eukprot:scaffold108273_cov60-Phaeocystis_antarctica.AAC.4
MNRLPRSGLDSRGLAERRGCPCKPRLGSAPNETPALRRQAYLADRARLFGRSTLSTERIRRNPVPGSG